LHTVETKTDITNTLFDISLDIENVYAAISILSSGYFGMSEECARRDGAFELVRNYGIASSLVGIALDYLIRANASLSELHDTLVAEPEKAVDTVKRKSCEVGCNGQGAV